MVDLFQSIHQFCTIDWSSVADIRARDPHIDYSGVFRMAVSSASLDTVEVSITVELLCKLCLQ